VPSPSENILFAQLERAQKFSIAGLPVIKYMTPAAEGFDSTATPKLAIGSHLGYGRIGLSLHSEKLNENEFLRVTKSLLNDKHLWYERATESALSLATLLGYLPVLTVACDSCGVTRDGVVELRPVGGPRSAYARYLRILADRAKRVIMIPTNDTDGHLFSLKHSGPVGANKVEEIEAALSPFIDVLKTHIAHSPARPYIFGGAIGVCLKDTAQTLGIGRGDGILLDEASYTNFPEELPLDQPYAAWRSQALDDAPNPRLVLGDLRATYSPTRDFETRQLGFPVLKFSSESEEE
jgi:hypothetical protein